MKTLTFFRHAESKMNILPDIIWWRSNNIWLSEKWLIEAQKLWKSLSYLPNRIIVSPANRTILTAKIALKRFWIVEESFEIDDNIQEISQWEWEWKKRSEIYTPEMVQLIASMNWTHKAPWWESQIDVQERMYKRVKQIINEIWEDEEVYLFSHGFSIRALVQKILWDYKPWEIHKSPEIANTGRTVLQYNNWVFYIPVFNDISHLQT